jgi:eukaryotic-like serine/threonine-protein kinase
MTRSAPDPIASEPDAEPRETAADSLLPVLEKLARPPRVPVLPAGTMLGRYRVVAFVDRGGMGQVYRAHDAQLGRDVAIKVLAPGFHGEEALRRFVQEARATCALNHANILDVHDIGSHEGSPYIVSELLHGVTLRERLRRGPLAVKEASGYALQLAQGLAAAHEKGIVHRDLKPENLFITGEGRLKILDFGIAKLLTSSTGETLASARARTEEGAILGTVGYMSPEQVRGEPADQRSDVFSFGAILYEMLAGRGAYQRNTAVETGSAILNDDPPPLPAGVPAGFDRIVRRCLAKRPEARFQSAHELVEVLAGARVERTPAGKRSAYRWALGAGGIVVLLMLAVLGWRLRARGEGPGNSIAVLPFLNMSSDRENEYFSDGITEELTNALANVEGLRVTSRTSAFAFKGKEVAIRTIGEELQVATLLEGSVRREGNSVRVTAQLVNAADGYHIWSNTYDREVKDVFALEDELARSIAQTLRRKLIGGELATLVKSSTTNQEAHDLYLRGLFFAEKRTAESLRKAAGYFQQAIGKDPAYALAYAGLGDVEGWLITFAGARTGEQLPKAKAAASKALELDDTLAEAHASLGFVSWYDYDWKTSERELRRAIELDPRNAPARGNYAFVLAFQGRLIEARAEIERARQLDPISPIINCKSALLHDFAREYPTAIEEAKKVLEMDPQFPIAYWALAIAYSQTGRYAEALAQLDASPARNADDIGLRGYILAISGQREVARPMLAELTDRAAQGRVSPSSVALIHAGLGDKDAAFAWLDKAYAERDFPLRHLKVAPYWDSLRSDPRFARLLQRVHLE